MQGFEVDGVGGRHAGQRVHLESAAGAIGIHLAHHAAGIELLLKLLV